ncbi:hypothetical protein LKM01_25110 [Bacillus pacificus]|uniref:hypothetical protein n=1 Tax=Bacillus cereus group TaxID=86661 RepID=UPI001E561823|nr:hypothetical protein [Bacillus pacificus]MCC2485075.1 hypothetical protein [Bacillus pacificus]
MKIENIESIVRKIEDLKKGKFSSEKIMQILDLEEKPEDILKEYEKEQGLYSIEDAATKIGEELNDKTWNYRKLYNLINCENPKIESVKKSNRQGIKIHIKEINRFIAEKKLTREDYKNLYDNEIDKNVELEKQMNVLKEEKDQKIAELEARIAELEAQVKKPVKTRAKKDEKETGKVE